jgi:hypothetical protein
MEARGDMIESIEAKRKELIGLQAQEVKGQEKLNKLNEAAVIVAQADLRAKTHKLAITEKNIALTEQELELLLLEAGHVYNLVGQTKDLNTAVNESTSAREQDNKVIDHTIKLLFSNQQGIDKTIEKAKQLSKEQDESYRKRRALAQSEAEQQAIDFEEKARLLKLENDLEKRLFDTKKKDSEEFHQFFSVERQTELKALDYQKQEKIKILANERAQTLALAALTLGDTEEFRKKELEINKLYNDLQTTQDEITAAKRQDLKRQERDMTIKFANEAFTGVLGFIEATQGQSEADARRAFNINKAAGIADATVNTYLAASQTLSDKSLPTIAKAFAVAGIIASGLAQVRKIAATKFGGVGGGGGGGTGGTAPLPSAGGAGGTAPATSFANPQTTLLGNQGQPLPQPQGNQPMRAYVVERDIQQTTSRVRRLSEFATFG